MESTSLRAKWLSHAGSALALLFAGATFWYALQLPIDLWDGYDYLVNARLIAGHDLTRLAQQYRTDRPPGISLLLAPLLAWGYQPGQRGLAGLIHLVPWALGVSALLLLFRWTRRTSSPLVGFGAAALVALNPLFFHYLPFVMADVGSLAFALASMFLAERMSARRAWHLAPALSIAVAAAMLMKYPMALLGLTIPLANAAWVWAGKGRPSTLKEKLLESIQPRLLVGLLGGLALFFLVHALLYSTVVQGPGSWSERMASGLRAAWAGGGSAGNTDPWWELPSAVFWTFGPGVSVLSVLGLVTVARHRDRAGLFHASWVLGMMALFVGVIGHKESRYVIPALPSIAYLAARGLAALKRTAFIGAGIAVMVVGIAPSTVSEVTRSVDPIYTRPSLLAWARFALERAQPDRPIIQHPNISPFALYPKNPVVFPMDEYWHYHHLNHGGLEWYFDRRLLAFQISFGPAKVNVEIPWIRVRVPSEWYQRVGEDALLLTALPKGAVIVRPPQGWFETASAAQQPEPPVPFEVIDITRVTLDLTGSNESTATFSNGTFTLSLQKGPNGWALVDPPRGSRWYIGLAENSLRRWEEPAPELPRRLDGLWFDMHSFPVRP